MGMRWACALWLLGSFLPPLARAGDAELGLHLSDCVVGDSRTPARCGTFVVYENRATRVGRTIALPMVVLLARQPRHHAVFWNPGGPGAPAVELASPIADGVFAKELTALR